jgi:protein-L-isoaspartate(D-aspartate) O-methyltransferase
MTSTALNDLEQARFNMVEQQIRTWEVLDQSVLDLLFAVKREDFVPPAYRALAFMDTEIPLGTQGADGENQTMMTPKLEARIIQELAPKSHERVLEIGTGSGYLTALLAKRAARVASIEYFQTLANQAAGKLAGAGIGNVEITVGDAAISPAAFLPAGQAFEIIVLTGSTPVLPEAYLPYLAIGGRMFAVIGDAPVMKATLISKTAANAYATEVLFETVLPPLIHAQQPSRFTF